MTQDRKIRKVIWPQKLKGDFNVEKFIPYKKMSKKKQREINLKKRTSWNGLNPVTEFSQGE